MRLIIAAALAALVFLEALSVVVLDGPASMALLTGAVVWLFLVQVAWGWACVYRIRQISHIDDGTY